MILAVVGSRTFLNYEHVSCVISKIRDTHNVTKIVSGGARGVDTLAAYYAREHAIPLQEIHPQWAVEGPAAGFARNKQIIDAADTVLAFWDGKSKGTKNSIDLARASGKQLFIIKSIKDVQAFELKDALV